MSEAVDYPFALRWTSARKQYLYVLYIYHSIDNDELGAYVVLIFWFDINTDSISGELSMVRCK